MTVRIVPTQFPTITAAVAASAPGDTVRIRRVTLTESVTIGPGKDRLTIIGEGPGKTIINGAGGPVFTIAGSSQVTIQGLTAQNTPMNIDVIDILTNANVIRDIEVRNGGDDGIQVLGDRNLIAKCNVHGNDEGIRMEGDNNYVIQCNVHDNRDDGIEIDDSRNNLVLESIFKDNGSHGIFVDTNAEFNLLIRNQCKKNARNGIAIRANNNAAIQNECDENNFDGILIEGTFVVGGATGNLVFDNKVDENEDDGIELNNADQTRIIDNDVEDSGDRGIILENDSDANVVDENEVEDSDGAGIFVSNNSDNNAIRRNELDDNNPDIEVQPGSTGNVIDEND
jgi:parallel beta-helix repeat protein